MEICWELGQRENYLKESRLKKELRSMKIGGFFSSHHVYYIQMEKVCSDSRNLGSQLLDLPSSSANMQLTFVLCYRSNS